MSIREVSTKIAMRLVDYAYRNGLAYHFPEPQDKETFITSHQYDSDYEEYIPDLYDWNGHATTLKIKFEIKILKSFNSHILINFCHMFKHNIRVKGLSCILHIRLIAVHVLKMHFISFFFFFV